MRTSTCGQVHADKSFVCLHVVRFPHKTRLTSTCGYVHAGKPFVEGGYPFGTTEETSATDSFANPLGQLRAARDRWSNKTFLKIGEKVMIIANLPCLEYCCQKRIVGGEKYSYGNGVAFTYAGSYTDGFDISDIIGRYRNGLNVSAFASKHDSGLNVSAVARTSINVGHGYAQSYSFAIAKSPSY